VAELVIPSKWKVHLILTWWLSAESRVFEAVWFTNAKVKAKDKKGKTHVLDLFDDFKAIVGEETVFVSDKVYLTVCEIFGLIIFPNGKYNLPFKIIQVFLIYCEVCLVVDLEYYQYGVVCILNCVGPSVSFLGYFLFPTGEYNHSRFFLYCEV
jgi:hypothetical protein